MEGSEAVICAYALDGDGRGELLDWADVAGWDPGCGRALWVHLERARPATREWLEQSSGLEPLVSEALLAEETRPRCTAIGDGLLVILRGVNLNPGADPEDMVSIRLWLEEQRIISVVVRKLLATQDVRDTIHEGRGPKTTGDFLTSLVARLAERMGPVVSDLEDEVDGLEDELLTGNPRQVREKIGALRRQAISLRRHIAPQREALARLQIETCAFIDAADRLHFREIADRITRYVEDLDSARERAAVVHEELMGRLSEHTNRTMYLLSIVAAVFLPLGLLTGLLGINVGGMPGTDSPWAFTYVTIGLVFLAVVQVLVFRRWKLI